MAVHSHQFLRIPKSVGVKSVKFGILSPDQIRKNSVCAIDNIIVRGSAQGTLNDPRLEENGGGFGHLELVLPVYNPLFFNDVLKILKFVCTHCSSFRVKAETDYNILVTQAMKKTPTTRLAFVEKFLSGKGNENCVYCHHPLYKISKDPEQNLGFKYELDDIVQPIYSHEVLVILERISDDDVKVLGFDPQWSRPDWMLFQVLPILPPQCRPQVMTDEGRISDDDLTQFLHQTIKFNRLLLAAITAAELKAQESNAQVDVRCDPTVRASFKCLQIHVASLIDNDTKMYDTICNRGHRKLNSISCLHKGKPGRWRYDIFGKRCESTARAVIGGNPQLSMMEIGVPKFIAMTLTEEDVVNIRNRNYLRSMVINGPTVYPGANEIQFPGDTFRRNLAAFPIEKRMSMPLEPGTVVFRHLVDGDIVMSNRQPTLHKMSMMAHRVRVFDTDNIQHSINNTPPYGADFDGDEMNILVPKKSISRLELTILCLTATQMVSPQAAKNIIGAVQDSQYGAYLASKQKNIRPIDFMHYCAVLGKETGSVTNTFSGTWSGKDLISEMLPPISMRLGNVEVEEGRMLSGELTSQHLSKGSHGGLVYNAWIEDNTVAAVMLDNFSRMSHEYFLRNPATVSLNDCLIGDDAMEKVIAIKRDYTERCDKLLHGFYNFNYHPVRKELGLGDMGVFTNDRERFEADILYLLTSMYTDCLAVARENIDKDNENRPFENGLMNMIKAGSKGNTTNLGQISTLLGNQNLRCGRPRDFLGGRSIALFSKGDIGPRAKGMVYSSFLEGLDTAEQFYHAMAGREGLINTAIKTADTGYMQRKMVETMKDVFSREDGTVRLLSNDLIIQFCYGGDGINGTHVQRQKLPLLYLSKEQLMEAVAYPNEPMCKPLEEACLEAWETMRNRYMTDYGIPEFFTSPVNVDSVIHASLNKAKLYPKTALTADVYISVMNRFKSFRMSMSLQLNKTILQPFMCILQLKLNPRAVYEKYRFTKEGMQELYRRIEFAFYNAMLHYGNAVGIIAGQSIGERSTQSALDAFHSTGKGTRMKLTGGVARMKEITAVQQVKTPQVNVFIDSVRIPTSLRYNSAVKDLVSLDNYMKANKSLKKAEVKQALNAALLIEYEQKFTHTTLSDVVVFQEEYYICDKYPVESPTLTAIRNYSGVHGPVELNNQLVLVLGIGKHRPNFFTTFSFAQLEEQYGFKFQYIAQPGQPVNLLVCCIDYMAYSPADVANLLNETICGINDIEGIEIDDTPMLMCDLFREDGSIIGKNSGEEYQEAIESTIFDKKLVINTKGSNLLGVLLTEGVNKFHTISNVIAEVEALYGIYAARQAIVEELSKIINPGGKINVHRRHLELLADTMTASGFIQKADRVGAKKGNAGPIALAGFEETMKVLARAAKNAEEDPMKGLSANIMFSQTARNGTAAFDVLMDEAVLEQYGHVVAEPTASENPSAMEDTSESIVNPSEDFDFEY